jgi:hypothetical protein
MPLDGVRLVLENAATTDTQTFARRARNELAKAVVAEALAPGTVSSPMRALPLAPLEQRVGLELAGHLASIYAGGVDWTSHAIDALEPLNALARTARV